MININIETNGNNLDINIIINTNKPIVDDYSGNKSTLNYQVKEQNELFKVLEHNKITFNPLNLFKQIPEKSHLYYQGLTDEHGLGLSVNNGYNTLQEELDDEEIESKLFQMFIKLNPNLGYEAKRKYLKKPPNKQLRLYESLFKTGAPLNPYHKHFTGGKNEQTLYHIEDKEATKYIAGYLGLPYHSSLYVKDPQANLTQKTHFLQFDESGLDISSIEFFEEVLWLTAHLGLRGKGLLESLPNARLVMGREALYENTGGY